MIPSGFEYHAAASVDDAIGLLGQFEDAKVLAGGHSLLPMMKLRIANPEYLVDINDLAAGAMLAVRLWHNNPRPASEAQVRGIFADSFGGG